MTQKKKNSSKLARSFKKGARSLLSGKKALAKFGASLPLLALFVEEVRAAQAKGYKPTAELLQTLPPEVSTELGITPAEFVQDENSAQQIADDVVGLEQKIQNARESLRAVLEDEISSAQTTANSNTIDPSSPKAGHQAISSVLNDEVSYEVAKALEASPQAAEVLATLPGVNIPQAFSNSLSGFSVGQTASSFVVAALTGGGGGGAAAGLGVSSSGAAALKFSGAAIDGYVQGATVNYQVKVNGEWTTVATTLTDAEGTYKFDGLKEEWASGRVVIEAGGYDANTGQQVGAFISNASASETEQPIQTATPLTMVLALSGLGEDEFKAQLGITEVADLGTFDPVDAMKFGNAALGEKVFAIQQGVYTLLQAASAVAGGGTATATSLSDAVAAVGKAIADNYNADLGVMSVSDITGAAISQVAVGSYATAVASAINLVNASINTYYTGLAEAFRVEPPTVESQSAIAAAKAAAAVSQSSLLAALVDGSTGTLTAFEGNFPAELAIQVAAFKEIAALEASDIDLSSTIANPVFLVHQALVYTGGMPTYTEVKDLAGEFTQISLAKLIDLNVKNVTLLGTNDRVELQMQGNGSTNTDVEIQANLVEGLFKQSYTVTLRVTDGDVAQIIKQLPNVDFKAIGIDMIKPVAGTLKISKADALDLIEEGLSFSTGSFQLKPGDSLSFAEVQKLVIEGGLKLADNTSVDLSGDDVQLDTDTAFELLAAGAKFTGANDSSLLLEARHLNGNAQAVVDKLLSLVGVGTATTGLGFVFDASSKSPASGVTFTAGKLALSGLTLTEAQAAALVNADISQSVKFNNTAITFKTTDYVGKVDSFVTELKALFKSGITKFTVSGDVTKDIATQLLNIDSSVQLYATVTEPLTASIAMGFAARGVTPTNVNFDIDYVKSYILVDGNKLTSTITVNVPFSDDTITPTDFVNLIAAGVRFQAGIGSVLIKETDAAFTMGSDAVANQLKLVNAGLKLASGSASLTDATLTLANAQKLQAAHVNAADPVFGDITLQLSSADLASVDLKSNLAKLNFADLTVRPISGALTAAQVDALQTIKPSTAVHFEFASLQLDANAIALAAQKAIGYYSDLGISNAVISVTSMSYAQAKALSLAGIAKVNAGVVLTLDNVATTDNFAQLDSLQAMGFAKLSVPVTTAISKAQFDAIVAEYPKFIFEPGSKIDLSDASNPGLIGTTLAKAATYSAAGLTLVNMDTLAAKDISLSQAVSLASKGAKFTSEVKGENLVIYKDADTVSKTYQPDLTMSQVKAMFASVSSGTEVSFSGFTSLRLSSTDLGNLDATMAAKLAKTGLPGISLIDAPSVNQVLKLAGTSLQLVGAVTLSDKSVSNVADALTVIAKGAVFSGASLVLPAEGGLQSLIGNGLDLDGKSIGVLKAKGFTTIDLSNGQISQADATTIMNWGGLKFANANLVTGTAPIDVSVVSTFAALGISVPSTAVISSSTNTITFDQALAIASKGGAIALASGSASGTHVTVNVAGKAALTFAEADIVLSKVQNVAFTGVNAIQLAAKNADFAAVTALAAKLQDAGITSIKLATGASLSVNIAQLQTLATEGVSFATGSDVRLQLTSGSLSDQFTAIGTLGSNTAGVALIKAAGASLTLTRDDFVNLPSTMKFVATDMVTVKVSTLIPDHLAAYNTSGVDFVGAEGGKITISAAAAQAVVTLNTVKLLPTDVVTVSLNSTELGALTSQSVALFKAVGVDNFVVAGGTNALAPLSAVKAILANQLSFTNNVTVDIALGNAADLNYVIDNSGSLASAGVKQVHVTGGEAALTMKQLSSLLAAGTGGVKFDADIKVAVTTAADLAYFAASAKDIQALQPVTELTLDASIINIPLATAQLLAKSYQLTPPATVLLDFASATQLSQDDFIALKAAGFVTFNFGGVSVDPSAQLDGLVAKLVGAGYLQGQLPVEVSGIMVNTTFANNSTDNTLKDFGFKDNTGFINKAALNLVKSDDAAFAVDGNLVFKDGVFKVFEKGAWTEAKTIISPTGAAVKIVATNSDNAITAAEFKALSSLTGGKVSFTGINLELGNTDQALALTAKVVSGYKALGLTSVDASCIGTWSVSAVNAVQSAGLKFANVNATKIADSTVNLTDYQAMKGLGFTFDKAVTTLRDKTATEGVTTTPSLTAAVAQQLLQADDIRLNGVVIKDGSLSAATALSLSKAGLNVTNVLVSGNVSVDDALALLNAASPLNAPTFAVKGFFSGNTLTATDTKQVNIEQALQLTKVLGLGNVGVLVKADDAASTAALLPKLATLLAQDATAKFATGSYLTCDSLTLSQAQQVFSLGVTGAGLKGAELKLTLDSSNSNFSEILDVAKALAVKVIDCANKPLTLSTTQHADYIASNISLVKVSGVIQLTVASPEDIAYVVKNAAALNGNVALATTSPTVTLTNEQFTSYQAAGAAGIKFGGAITVSLTQDQLDGSTLAATLATLKLANVAGVVCLADKGLSNEAVAVLREAGVTVLGSPTLKVQPLPEDVGALYSAGFNVQVTPDLTNVSVSKALTLAAIEGVKTVSLVSSASELTVSQSDWLNPSARALIDKVLLSTGSKPAMTLSGVDASKIDSLLAEQGVTIKQLALQAGQSIISSAAQWDGYWKTNTAAGTGKVTGLEATNVTIAGVTSQADLIRLAKDALVDKVYLSTASSFTLDATTVSDTDAAYLAKVYYAGGATSLISSLVKADAQSLGENGALSANLFTNDTAVNTSGLGKALSTINGESVSLTVDKTVSTDYGQLVISSNGGYTFTAGNKADALAEGESAQVSFSYTVQNGTTSQPSTFVITVTGSNDAPVVQPLAANVLEDANVRIAPDFIDVDKTNTHTISFDATAAVGNVTYDAAAKDFVYNAAGRFDSLPAGVKATDTFTYTVTDSSGASATKTVTLTVTGVNDAPALASGGVHALVNVVEDQQASPLAVELVKGIYTDVDAGQTGQLHIDTTTAPTYTAYVVNDAGEYLNALGNVVANVQDAAVYKIDGVSVSGTIPSVATDGTAIWLSGTSLNIDPTDISLQGLNKDQFVKFVVDYKVSDGTAALAVDQVATFIVEGKNEGKSFADIKIIDGYVSNARVFYDANNDGKLSDGEHFAFTGADGQLLEDIFVPDDELNTDGLGKLVAELDWLDADGKTQHAVDTFTGKELSGDLIAPEDFAYVTPLTTLVALTMKEGDNAADLAADIAKGLGLTVSLESYDPFAEMTGAGNTAQAELVFKAQQMVFTVMQATTTALGGSATALQTMANAVTKAILASDPVPNASLASTISSITQTAIGSLFDANDVVALAKANAITASVDTVNAQINESYSGLAAALQTNDVAALAKAEAAAGVSQDLLIKSVQSVAKAEDATAINNATLDDAAIKHAVTEAVSQNPDVANNSKFVHTESDVNTLSATLKSLSGKLAIVMDGVAGNSDTTADVSINFANAADGTAAFTGGVPGITAKVDGVALSEQQLNVTLNVSDADQLTQVADIGSSLNSAGIDAIQLNLDGQSALDGLFGGNNLATNLSSLRANDLVIDTIDMVSTDTVVLSDTNASTLLGNDLSFAAGDDITVDASNTHLSTSLKDLQKLGVDGVGIAGQENAINLDLGSDSFSLSSGGLPTFEAGLDVTLNVSTIDQLGQVAKLGGELLSDVGLDNVQLNLTGQTQLDELLLSNLGDKSVFDQQLNALDGISLTTIDMVDTGAVNLSDTDAKALLLDGLHFVSDDQIHVDVSAEHTHLSTSLKDLQKLGVDAVAVAGEGADGFNIDVGFDGTLNASGLPTFTDGDDVTITLNAANAAQLGEVAALSKDLADVGIDNVEFSIASDGELSALLSNADFSNNLVAVRDNLTLSTIDMAGNAAVSLTDGEASTLLEESLSFAADDTHITLEAEAGSTHLSTSLKDLQKLGVDGVAVSGTGTENDITIDFGADGSFDLAGGLTSFVGGNNVDVTLNVDGASQAAELADLAGVNNVNLSALGIDNVSFTFGDAELNDLFSSNSALKADIDAIQADGVKVNGTFDLVTEDGIQLTQDQAAGLLADGLSFAADDTIGLSVDAAQSTHLSTSLKDLQKLGVDAVAVAGLGDDGTDGINIDAGGTLSATGLPTFTDADGNDITVTLNVADSTQLGQVADLSEALSGVGIDNVEFSITSDGELSALLGNKDFASDLDAIRENFTLSTIDMVDNAAVSLTDSEASTLLTDGLSFAADDTHITLQADSGSTHLSTSLKDLQKLGVDAVSVAGAGNDITIDFGAADSFDLAGGVTSFLGGSKVDVTLNVDGANQAAELADLSAVKNVDLSDLGIDNVKFTFGDAELNDLLSSKSALNADINAIQAEGVKVSGTIDLVETDGIILSQDQAASLLADGLSFAADDSIDLSVSSQAGGTHLTTSLKDLQKLGVDAVAITGDGQDISLDLGSDSSFDFAGSVTSLFDKDLNFTLNIGSADQLAELAALGGQSLSDMGIDNVQINLAGQDALNQLLSVDSVEFDQQLARLDGISFTTIDMAADTQVSLSDDQASALLADGLNFASDDIVELSVDAAQTNLTTSLKDLQKLGVDAVAVAGEGVDGFNINVGAGEALSLTGLPTFNDGDEITVTLNVGDAAQLGEVAGLSEGLAGLGIDNVEFSLASGAELNALLSNVDFADNLASVRGELTLSTIDMVSRDAVALTQEQASVLLDESLSFAADDNIDLSVSSRAEGTHLTTSLKDLQKLGVDAVAITGAGQDISLELGSDATFELTSGVTDLFTEGANVTLTVDGAGQLAELAAFGGKDLAGMGIDNVQINLADQDALTNLLSIDSVTFDQQLADLNGISLNTIDMAIDTSVSLSDADASALLADGLSFAADDNITVEAGSTHLSTSLKDLQKLGVDAVAVAGEGNEITVDFGADGSFDLTGGVTNFLGENNVDVTLNVNGADQLTELATLGGDALTGMGIDNVQINLADQDALTALLSVDSAAFDQQLARLDGISLTTIDMAIDTSVSLSDADASALLADGLSFAADDNITVEADSTHLSTSLKDLQKLGVDAVALTGTSNNISVELGADGTFELTSGVTDMFAGSANVTLNVDGADQLAKLASFGGDALVNMGIDNVQINLADQDALTALLSVDSAAFDQQLARLDGISLNTIDMAIDTSVSLSDADASALLADGLSFAADDNITVEAGSTHLSTSLKDLQKLGVDAVAFSGAGSDLSVDLGANGTLDLSGGVAGLFNENLNVTLNVSGADQAAELASLATAGTVDLSAMGIDNVNFSFGDSDLLAWLNGTGLSNSINAIQADGVSVGGTIDLVNPADFSFTDVQAHELVADGLQFVADDSISLQAEAGSTHLSTSLKDLQKLGIDAVSVATGATVGDALHVNLGGGEALTAANLPSFDLGLNVTLDVTNAAQLAEIASLGGAALTGMGIDNVELSLAGQAELNDLLASAGNAAAGLTFDLAELNNTALTVNTIDMGGSVIDAAAHITAADVSTLVDAGLHFAANDYISMDVSAAQSTHLASSLQDLKKLGVDTVNVSLHEQVGAQLGDLADLTSSLKDAALDLGLFASDLAADSALLSKVEAFDWVRNGVDFSLQIDTPAAATVPQSIDSLLGFVDNGIDLLNIGLSDTATWGELIGTLRDAGLGNVEVASQASVSISDDLSAALYESGMLHALPDAAISIDAGLNKVLNTSLKAMADLGVDSVNSDHKVYVELGIKPEDLATVADLGDLLSTFGLDNADNQGLFHGQQAGLVIDQTTFSNLGEANIETLVGQLSKLGFTELDVVGSDIEQGADVYTFNVTAQTPVLSQVQILGSADLGDLAHVFDPDILHKAK